MGSYPGGFSDSDVLPKSDLIKLGIRVSNIKGIINDVSESMRYGGNRDNRSSNRSKTKSAGRRSKNLNT